MNEHRIFEQRSGLGRRGSWTSKGQRITTRQPQVRSQRQVQPDVDEDEIYEDAYPPRLPTSTRRYSAGYDVSDDEIYEQGNTRLHVRYVDIPKRRQAQLPPSAPTRDPIQDEDERPARQKRKVHWLVFAGLAVIIMIVGWTAINLLATWWQMHTDDATYGNPRTYQTDAVVGHADSPTSPTHCIAVNLNGNIIVIELPGGDAGKARSYAITSIPGNTGNPPVKLVFQDINRDGKLDMVVQIGDPGQIVTVLLFNNGTQFVSKL